MSKTGTRHHVWLTYIHTHHTHYMRTLSPEGILRGGNVDEVGLRGEARAALGVVEAEVALLVCGVYICVSDVWETMSAHTHARARRLFC